MKFIGDRINAEAERAQRIAAAANVNAIDDDNAADVLTSFDGHVKLGSPRPPKTLREIMGDHRSKPEFDNFHRKFTNFINQCLPVYLEHDANTWNAISFPETFEVCEVLY